MTALGASFRLEGICEQYKRATVFLDEAGTIEATRDRFRRVMASVYFCRAVVELMFEAAGKDETTKSRKETEGIVAPLLPRYMLMEKLRIHDFHRFGVLPRQYMMMGGSVKLTAVKGYAVTHLTERGIEVSTSGESQVSLQRPLLTRGVEVLDDETGEWLPVEKAVAEYLSGVPKAIEAFRGVLKKAYGGEADAGHGDQPHGGGTAT